MSVHPCTHPTENARAYGKVGEQVRRDGRREGGPELAVVDRGQRRAQEEGVLQHAGRGGGSAGAAHGLRDLRVQLGPQQGRVGEASAREKRLPHLARHSDRAAVARVREIPDRRPQRAADHVRHELGAVQQRDQDAVRLGVGRRRGQHRLCQRRGAFSKAGGRYE